MTTLLPLFCSLRVDALTTLLYRLAMVDPRDDETEMLANASLEAAAATPITGRARTIADLERAELTLRNQLVLLLDVSNPPDLDDHLLATEAARLRRELTEVRARLEQERANATRRN